MSAPRDDTVFVRHIRDAIARIESYLDGVTEEAFLRTPIVQDAVIRQIQIIGEAAKRLSNSFRDSTPAIPWADIAGMRDKLVHDYMGVQLDAVYETAARDIPALKVQLDRMDGPGTGSWRA